MNLLSYLVVLRATLAREVRVIMTPAAHALLPAPTVAFACDGVFVDEPLSLEKRPGHIELASWSDLLLVLPASANLLGQAANGLAPNLLATTILASPRPVVFCPNVHDEMWNKKAVHRNVRMLREDGHIVMEPDLAPVYEVDSGEMRESRALPEPELLAQRLQEILVDVEPFV